MAATALVVTLAGLVLSLGGAGWLFFGFSPDNPKYTDDGMLYPGQQRSQVVPQLLRTQRKAVGLVAAGGAMQVVGGVLALVALS